MDARSELSNRTKVTFLAFHSFSSAESEMQTQPTALTAGRPRSSSWVDDSRHGNQHAHSFHSLSSSSLN